MIGLYEALNEANPNARNVVLTVIDGADRGAKCFLAGDEPVWVTAADFFSAHQAECRAVLRSGVIEMSGQRVYAEVLGQEKKLVICGGGHISMPLIRMGRMLGCSVTVLEDRPSFADNARQAGATTVICDDFDCGLAQVAGDDDTFFIIVTRGHRHDQTCLAAISRKRHAYIGMIGSRRRVALVKDALIAEGCDREIIGRVYSPIGLEIGAETPEEIAVAIMAEIIQVRSRSGRSSTWPRELLRAIISHDGQASGERLALATIVSRRGSAPRDVGTKMLIRRDGSLVGTIGGGCVENDVVRTARELLDEGSFAPQLIQVDMSGADAEDQGMVCGGTIEVWVECI